MALVLRRDETTGDGRTVLPPKDEQEKARGPALIGARKPCFSTEERLSRQGSRKPGSTQALDLSTPVLLPAACCLWYRRRLPPPTARDAGCHVRTRALSAALVGGGCPRERPTPRQFCWGYVGQVSIDRPRWDSPFNRPSEGRGGPRVPGPPHS